MYILNSLPSIWSSDDTKVYVKGDENSPEVVSMFDSNPVSVLKAQKIEIRGDKTSTNREATIFSVCQFPKFNLWVLD